YVQVPSGHPPKPNGYNRESHSNQAPVVVASTGDLPRKQHRAHGSYRARAHNEPSAPRGVAHELLQEDRIQDATAKKDETEKHNDADCRGKLANLEDA